MGFFYFLFLEKKIKLLKSSMIFEKMVWKKEYDFLENLFFFFLGKRSLKTRFWEKNFEKISWVFLLKIFELKSHDFWEKSMFMEKLKRFLKKGQWSTLTLKINKTWFDCMKLTWISISILQPPLWLEYLNPYF